jgi:acetylornithine deacetylase/succinyl-diaminopimelate desuccinylase-like protein
MIAPGTPTITMGLRGIAACEVQVHGPVCDIHSGLYGGLVLNPLQALTKILAALHNQDGSVAVPGFYDGIVAPSPEDVACAKAAPIDFAASSARLGVPFAGGERGYSEVERKGFRPTLEINGVGGGYQGAGGKTVIPASAFAKLSMRFVAGQDPQRILELVSSYVQSLAPQGVTVAVVDGRVGGGAFQLSTASPVIAKAREATLRAFGRDPVMIWEGASVPIIPALAAAAGAAPLLVGFGLEEDLIHSPNESFSLRQFQEGYLYAASFLSVL